MATIGLCVKKPAKTKYDNVFEHIFTPRIYQVALLDVALRRNSVICLGSSAAKHFLAVMLIKELAYMRKCDNHSDSLRTVGFFNNENAAQEFTQVLAVHTDLKVHVITSDADWSTTVLDYHVVITTALSFLAAVSECCLSLSQINLAIFDECRDIVNFDHPYAKVMSVLNPTNSCDRDMQHIRILGLSTSILTDISQPCELEQRLARIEQAMRSTVEMASDSVVADLYNSRPRESLPIVCKNYVDTTGVYDEISGMLTTALDFVNDAQLGTKDDDESKSTARLVISETSRILSELGLWCAARVAAAFVRQLNKLEKPSNDFRQLLLRMSATVLRAVEKRVDTVFDRLVQTLSDFSLFVSPKALQLVDVLRESKPDDSFEIISGDFDGDFDSDGCDTDDSMQSSSDEGASGCPGAEETKKTSKNEKKNSLVSGKKSVGSCSQHYVAVRRAVGSSGTAVTEDEGICAVIFVVHRHTAFALNKLIVELCNWDPDLYFVRSHYIASYSTPSEAQCLKQEDVLRKFRQREINVLVATSSLEEGVDLPRCNVVIQFDPPPSYRSYIQSKGRARAAVSKYCILVDSTDAEKFSADLDMYKGIESILRSRCHNENDFSREEIDEVVVNKLLPAFCPSKEPDAPQVTMTSAIRIVNRYCAKLPSDTFTHLTPKCCVEMVSGGNGQDDVCYRATVHLPINSPMKCPIVGDTMHGRRLAQMAAAVKTCIKLHEDGELDNHLQPVGKELIKYEDEDCEWEEHELHGQARPGTTKRKQYYNKKVAAALLGGPKPDTVCCLYVFHMTLTCPITEEQNTRGRPIHAPEDTPRGFGLLCERQLPLIPEFPVFTRSGEVTVAVRFVSEVSLDAAQLSRLYNFYHFIFRHVLRLEKLPMTFEPHRAETSNVIVPVNKDATGAIIIDWDFLSLIENSPFTASLGAGSLPTSERRLAGHNRLGSVSAGSKTLKEPFVFDEAVFADAVVMPSYRNIDQPQYFYVAEIRHDLTPCSAFPSPELYDTFEHYYKCKYGLVLTLLNQPLLDVDHTSARLNLLTPRYVNQKGVSLPTSSAVTRRAKRENLQQKQILVPELCDVHPFPAPLWRKAVCLPAMLYRMNCLLIADELRCCIAIEACIGDCDGKVNASDSCPPLRFGFCDISQIPTGQQQQQVSAPSADLSQSEPNVSSEHQLDSNLLQGLDTVSINNDILGCSSDSESHRVASNSSDVSVNMTDGSANTADEVATSNPHANCTVLPLKNSCDEKAVRAVEAMNDVSGSACRCCTDRMCHVDVSQKPDSKVCSTSHCHCCVAVGKTVLADCVEVVASHENCISTGIDCQTGDSISHACSDTEFQSSQLSLDADTSSAGGPSACDVIQALTMSNANDFFNLERLETIGDSFLKFAISIYLYCMYPGIHEGKLSYLRSIQVSNYNLYRLGKRKHLPDCMVAVKFEPSENWLPPCYTLNAADSTSTNVSSVKSVKSESNQKDSPMLPVPELDTQCVSAEQRRFRCELEELSRAVREENETSQSAAADNCMLMAPYSLQTQHSLPDKSIADCVEALIGCYLASCGSRAALQFMDWLGLHVLSARSTDALADVSQGDGCGVKGAGSLPAPASPLLRHVSDADTQLEFHLRGYDVFERHINYTFRDRSYLLQAFTHASYHYNEVTDCYQRLEFLGDAILDYIITRHLYEDSKKHSPGVLTDLRSALVNNNIFACLAVKWNFHKYFKMVSPQLFAVIEKFVCWQMEHDYQVILDEEMDCLDENGEEDIEIPKALGDIFESVAGAIYLDSGMSLDTVWKVYYRIMKPHIDAFLAKIPKSPVRELLEMEPETAKFEKPERTSDGKIRVTVNVVGKGTFTGVGRNYRIAKSAAAKRALKYIKVVMPSEMQQQMSGDYPVIYMR